MRPNYFIALRVSNKSIIDNVIKIQKSIIEINPSLSDASTPPTKSHLTLFVMKLEDSIEINKVIDAMKKSVIDYADQDQSNLEFQMRFYGIGHFNDRVLYAKPEYPISPHLKIIWRLLLKNLKEIEPNILTENVSNFDNDFSPHLTIMKMKRFRKKSKEKNIPKKISAELYEPFLNLEFGEETFKSLQLLSMEKPEVDKYYHNEFEVSFI